MEHPGADIKQALMACAPPAMGQVAQSEFQQGRVVAWNEQVAREALRREVSQHCCWGKGPVDSMQITNLGQTSSYHLKVTTFLEQRSVEWTTEPYPQGNFVDGPDKGQAPGLWQMQVNQPQAFQSSHADMVVPHTDQVRMCEKCGGMGKCTCTNCAGAGTLQCTKCTGQGHVSCHRCSGKGVPRSANPDKNWNQQAMCDGKRAHERMEWLMTEEGMTEAAAKVRVKREFSKIFADMDMSGDWWDPSAKCDGTSASDRVRWLEQNENMSHEQAKLRVRAEFPKAFGRNARASSTTPEWWKPLAMCDGTPAQDRAQWLVDNEGLTVGEARSRIRKEFPAVFASPSWNAYAMCDGTLAKDRAEWLVNNEGLSSAEAEKRVMSEFPAEFASASPTRSSRSYSGESELSSFWNPEEDNHCDHCTGKGRVTCGDCNGRTIVDCKVCHTAGVVTCSTCSGHGSLKSHLMLHVKWTNEVDETVLNGQGSALRTEEVKSAAGPQFEVKGLPVQPATQFGSAVQESTKRLCDQACAYQQKGYVHLQKMLIKQVPVCEVQATNNGQMFTYTIYGEDMRVNAENYPSKACWGCTIS